jgi:hypothetical protein
VRASFCKSSISVRSISSMSAMTASRDWDHAPLAGRMMFGNCR